MLYLLEIRWRSGLTSKLGNIMVTSIVYAQGVCASVCVRTCMYVYMHSCVCVWQMGGDKRVGMETNLIKLTLWKG